MRRLSCRCGQAVYFENHRCTNCARQLGFDPASLAMLSETEPGAGLRFCSNRDTSSRCNWVRESDREGVCLSCRSSDVIPMLSKPANRDRWRKLEAAKRRLLYDLLRLALPVDSTELRFVFKEDRRTNPHVHEEHVAIGHSEGVITINAAEADEVFREQMRELMNEPNRTLLGHFRHESGHYYFDVIVGADAIGEARRLFGDERENYESALQRHYDNGPAADWVERFISAYASAHPSEDWAETWAHYLHLCAVLETAVANGLLTTVGENEWQTAFIDTVIRVNEIMRSLGLADAYPFVITPPVAAKMDFIHTAIRDFTGRPGEPWFPAD